MPFQILRMFVKIHLVAVSTPESNFDDVAFMPPQALKVEQAVLGALLSERRAVVAVIDLLQISLFYYKNHQDIYKAIIELAQEEEPVDMLTVSERLRRHKKLKEVGGNAYLAKLSTQVSSSVHVETHVRLLIEYSVRRSLIELAVQIRQSATAGKEDALELLDTFEQKLFDIGKNHLKGEYISLEKALSDLLGRLKDPQQKKKGALTGVPSGFVSLDRITGGWQKGDLIIVAARPAMGKTAFVTNMLRNAALDFDMPVGFFSLEMSSRQLAERLISSEAGIESHVFRKGTLTGDDMQRLASDEVQKLLKSSIYIDDTAALNIMELRAKARRLCAKHQVQLIIVDYLQLMRGEEKRSQSNREQEIASISRTLKSMAKELDVPVIAVSQINRAVESRQNRRPMLSDLRESGAIEQDADMVLLLYRPEYYDINEDEEGNSTKGLTEVIVAKHRNGPVGSIRLHFAEEYTRFEDMSSTLVEDGESATYRTLPSRLNESGENPETNLPF